MQAEAGLYLWEKRLHEHDYEVWAISDFDDVPVSSHSARPDADAIVDAHNEFPKALTALEAVNEVCDKALAVKVNGSSEGEAAMAALAATIQRAIESALEAGE